MTDKTPEETLRLYGRRRGHKLRPGRQALIENLLPRLRLEPPTDGGNLDLSSALSEKMEKNALKYPVEEFRGRYVKPAADCEPS